MSTAYLFHLCSASYLVEQEPRGNVQPSSTMTTPPIIRELHQLLAKLFLDAGDADTLMAEAGIERSRINADASPLSRWYAIVSEASKDGKVSDLLNAALNRYPKNTELLAIQKEVARSDAEREANFLEIGILSGKPRHLGVMG